MLRAGVEVVSEVVYCEALAWSFVMFELGEVWDGQPQVLAVVGGPVLMHFLLIEALRSREEGGGVRVG
jgi:hypothetical protein